MKVLVAIDGSDNCLRALRYVLNHAEVFGSRPEIVLITVHLPVPSPRAKAWLGRDALDQYYADESQQALAAAREALQETKLKATEVWAVGDPGVEINKCAAEHGVSMIVMGTHGRSSMGNLLMGSVSTKVLAGATAPVLLVR